MKYRDYQTDDYLQDPQFIDWVLHPTPEKNIFWQEWMKSHPEHREKILAAREIILFMNFGSLEPTEGEDQEVLHKILQGRKSFHGAQSSDAKRLVASNYKKVMMRTAAVVLLCLTGAVFWVSILRTSHETPMNAEVALVTKKAERGQKLNFALPDGSKVFLNAESKISYKEGFAGQERAIELTGEAFFTVATDTVKPFVVKTGDLYTKALGTAFNIKAYDGDSIVEVSLTHGKVEVGSMHTTQKHNHLTLQPGERARYQFTLQDLQKDTLHYQADIAWKEGVIYFSDASFEEVIKRLERWYDVDFIVTEGPFEPWHYSGTFTNVSLERVLERMAYVEDFSFVLQEKKVYLTFKQ